MVLFLVVFAVVFFALLGVCGAATGRAFPRKSLAWRAGSALLASVLLMCPAWLSLGVTLWAQRTRRGVRLLGFLRLDEEPQFSMRPAMGGGVPCLTA